MICSIHAVEYVLVLIQKGYRLKVHNYLRRIRSAEKSFSLVILHAIEEIKGVVKNQP